jgi:hypothetical protein
MSDVVTPFRLDVPESALADLRERLARTRWPEEETVGDWSQGVPGLIVYTELEICHQPERIDVVGVLSAERHAVGDSPGRRI